MIQPFLKVDDDIAEGTLFRRGMGGALSEIVEVIDVGQDRMGIPHVRFYTHLMRGNYASTNAEQRTLSLESFCARYRERVRINETSGLVEPLQ